MHPRPLEPAAPDFYATRAPAEPEPYEIELLEPAPIKPPAYDPAPTVVPEHEPAPIAPAPIDPPAHAPTPSVAAAPERFVEPEPIVPAPLQYAAFAVQSAAGARVFAETEDGRLVHEPGNTAPGGWEVHGFVTDSHPGILFVLAAEGPTGFGSDGRATAHAFRIEESGNDSFALFDLATGAYLCAPQFEPGVNQLENNRGVVDAWEMFHLVAVEGATLPSVLPPLLPPAGTPITAASLQAWRRPK